MLNSLRRRILAAFLGVIVLSVLLSLLIAYFSARIEIDQFANDIGNEEAENLAYLVEFVYFEKQNWDGVRVALRDYGYDSANFEEDFLADFDEDELEIFYDNQFFDIRLLVLDEMGVVQFDSYGDLTGERIDDELEVGTADIYNWDTNEPIGSVAIELNDDFYSQEISNFLSGTLYSSLIGGLVSSIVALIIGWWLAQRISQPVTTLTAAATRLAESGSAEKLPVKTADELGQMSNAFNQLTDALSTQRNLRKRLISDVSHELNTPLSVIALEAKALRDGLNAPESAAKQIEQEVSLLKNLVQDLNLLAETDQGLTQLAPEPTDMIHFLSQTHARWLPQADAQQITLTLTAPPNLPTLTIDPTRISQVLGNLIRNALQHTPANGTIHIEAKQTPIPTRKGNWLLVSIRDSGAGIASIELSHIFERFYRADTSRQRHSGGRGLGLSIVKQLVDLHNGHIWAESEIGKGSVFFVVLPM